MPKSWIIAPTLCVLALSASACHPDPVCKPGDRCEDERGDPPRPLSPEQAEARLGDIHDRYLAAAKDGLDEHECRELSASYQALFERDPSILVARFNVAAVHESCGQLEQAEQIYVELAKKEFPSALNNLGVLAWQRDEHERAFALFERSVAADETHAIEARNNLAMALRERYASKASEEDFDAAELQLKNILAVDSGNKAAYENLARLYYDRGRITDKSYLVLANLVVTQAQRVLEAQGRRSADLHNLRGLLLIEDDDQVRALRAFKRAVEIEPEHLDANRNIAMIAIRFRDYETAERSLEAVLDHAAVAEDTNAWIALGVAKRGLRKFTEAEQAYRRALEVDPKDPRPWYNLGILAQEHLSAVAAERSEEALTATYEQAREHFQTFVDRAGTAPRWRSEVAEANDRIVVVEDSIETIEKMKQIEAEYQAMLEKERQQKLERIEELKRKEAAGTSVGEILEEQ
jgi:tetratricopeptide (TPR) repeat protein